MASIFLSYHRDDQPRAEVIAALFERAGHSVWWDRHITGGHEFEAEIEAALEAADKIVVLWSAKAIKSAWVRDEAGVGRDTGRLVPATLDGTLPPLGFRQFQTINLSKSKKRLSSPELDALVEAVGSQSQAEPRPRSQTKSFSFPKRAMALGAVVLLVLAALGATAAWLRRSNETSGQPRIAILPADNSPLSQQAARDLVLRVPSLPGADASAYQLVDSSQAASSADAVFTIAAVNSNGAERRDLVLRAPDQAILWSTSLDQPSAKSAGLPQQLAVEAQRVLSCAAEALSYREAVGQDSFRIYVSACTNFDNPYADADDVQLINLFQQVIAKAPHFTAAWAKLLVLDLDDINNGRDRHSRVLATRAHVLQARKLGLDFAELATARMIWISPTDFTRLFDNFQDTFVRYPHSAAVWRIYAERSWHVGRMTDAVDAASAAIQYDPLSRDSWELLIKAYAYAGQTQQAFAQLQKAEQLFPGSPLVNEVRYAIDLRYGDPKEALALMRSSEKSDGLQPQQAAFLAARIDPSPINVERVIAQDEIMHEQNPNFIAQIVQTLATFGRKDQVIDLMLHYPGGPVAGLESETFFRPALRDVWRDPRSMAAAAHLGLLQYWKTSGNWPDFCSDPKLPYDCKKEAAKYAV
jgi:tetratricopeptide (TPR) repeat protein